MTSMTATAALEQIVAQAGSMLDFNQLTSTGPDHARKFLCELKVDNVVVTNAEKSSLKAAKQECCSFALRYLRKWAVYGYREPGAANPQVEPEVEADDADNDTSTWVLSFDYVDKPPVKDKVFFTRLGLNGRPVAFGTGRTKKDAQHEAAVRALHALKSLASAVHQSGDGGDQEKAVVLDSSQERNSEPQPWAAALETFARVKGDKLTFHEERDGLGYTVTVLLKSAAGECRELAEAVKGFSLATSREEAARQSFLVLLQE